MGLHRNSGNNQLCLHLLQFQAKIEKVIHWSISSTSYKLNQYLCFCKMKIKIYTSSFIIFLILWPITSFMKSGSSSISASIQSGSIPWKIRLWGPFSKLSLLCATVSFLFSWKIIKHENLSHLREPSNSLFAS